MHRRQTDLPSRWLFADERMGGGLWATIERLPRGSGIVVRHRGAPGRRRLLARIHRTARARGLRVVDEAQGAVARVHDARELRRALSRRTPLIFLSPIEPTRSHPGMRPLPRMRAAALVRLSPKPLFALGGMDDKGFRRVRPLGFAGWGGIDAWLEN